MTEDQIKAGTFAGCLLGSYPNPNETWLGLESDKQKVLDYEAIVGQHLAVHLRYVKWGDVWPNDLDTWNAANGRVPHIAWGSPGQAPSLATILNGSHDALITRVADTAKAFGHSIFLRLLWEMNGNWSAWDGSHNSNNPFLFTAAWRHIRQIFDTRGAANVIWVWSPNATDNPGDSWNHWMNYYPGDAYVDWVGVDGYNWGTTQPWSSWQPLLDVVRPLYSDYSVRKPIMVAETASTEQGGSKAAWINYASRCLRRDLIRVKAFVWFQSIKETDWRINSSPTSLAAYKALAATTYFKARVT